MRPQVFTLEEHRNLLNELQILLKRQIKVLQNNKLGDAERLIERVDVLIKKILEIETSQTHPLKNKYQEIVKSYKKLELIIESEKQLTSKQLSKVTKGKKIIQLISTKKYFYKPKP